MTQDQIDFLINMNKKMQAFRDASADLAEVFAQAHNYSIDVNDYIVDDYPFTQSFDELDADIGFWWATAAASIETVTDGATGDDKPKI